MLADSQEYSNLYYVRWGALGEIRRFRAHDGTRYERGQRVLCQTERGVFVGNILSKTASVEVINDLLIRPMRVEDELLQQRLEKFKFDAVLQCRAFIESMQFRVQLLDVEHSFDGRSLWFHFVGDIPPEMESLTDELAEQYESLAKTSEFTKLLEEGCGPGCGTTSKSGCGSPTGCVSCSAKAVCHKG